MILLLAVVAAVGVGLVATGAPLGRRAFLVAAVPLALVGAWVATQLGRVVDGRPPTAHASWVGGLGLTIDLRLDGPAAIMALVVTVVGVAVLLYATRYFARDAPDLGRLAGLLVLFAGAMVGLVLADHLLVLYSCWELTSITSYLLIGNRHTESRARAAALQALLVTGAGGLALLGGLVLLGQAAGTYRLSTLLAHPPADTAAVKVGLVLILVGAFTKSAQYPFHAWLPGAMAAPTPVSAYLHSATMVKAGVFLVARFAPTFATIGPWRPLVFTAGGCSLVFGGLRALRQHDLKRLLAFGTVSQLGLLMLLFGAGTTTLATAGWVLLIAHAAFKATLFMVVGIVDHQTGTRDLRRLPALRAGWRGAEVVTILAAASMAGIPLGAGFIAKELAYDGLAHAPFAGHGVLEGVVVVGSMFTVAYAARFWWGAFVGPRRRAAAAGRTPPARPAAAPAPSSAFLAPAAVLAVVGVVLGVAPALEDRLVAAASAARVHLALWHGLGLPLLLSAVTLAGGAALFFGDRWLQPKLALGGAIPSGNEVYTSGLRGLGAASSRLTGFVQNGSLPVYAGVILLTAAVLPAGALLVGRGWAGWPPFGALHELPVLGLLVVAAFGAALVRRRFAAAVFLGVAGYAMAGVFVLSGAPDLALTQAAVETLSTVVFVLVLRRLPERFERQSTPRRRVVRVVIAGAVGVTVFVFALMAAGYRIGPPVSQTMVAKSVSEGHGRNVVNVILVDFRGFDTLGEITVLAVGSIGAVALARAGRRGPGAGRRAGAPPTAAPPGTKPATSRYPAPAPARAATAATAADAHRLAFVDVAVRVVFHVVLMTSLWLLFAGHNQPGGGFVGGLLAGSAITLRYIAGGIAEVRARSRFRPWTVLGSGLLLATVTAAVPIALGGHVLEVGYASLHVPVIGEVHLSSALAFDTGVYLAVVGMVLMAFEAFGDDPTDPGQPVEPAAPAEATAVAEVAP